MSDKALVPLSKGERLWEPEEAQKIAPPGKVASRRHSRGERRGMGLEPSLLLNVKSVAKGHGRAQAVCRFPSETEIKEDRDEERGLLLCFTEAFPPEESTR